MCTKRGAYGVYALRKLAVPRRSALSRSARDKLRRIAKHGHPHSKASLGPAWRVIHLPDADEITDPATRTRIARGADSAVATCAFDGAEVDADFEAWMRQQAEDDDDGGQACGHAFEGEEGC